MVVGLPSRVVRRPLTTALLPSKVDILMEGKNLIRHSCHQALGWTWRGIVGALCRTIELSKGSMSEGATPDWSAVTYPNSHSIYWTFALSPHYCDGPMKEVISLRALVNPCNNYSWNVAVSLIKKAKHLCRGQPKKEDNDPWDPVETVKSHHDRWDLSGSTS